LKDLGVLLARKQQTGEAIQWLRAALSLTPSNAHANLELAMLLKHKCKNFDEILSLLEIAASSTHAGRATKMRAISELLEIVRVRAEFFIFSKPDASEAEKTLQILDSIDSDSLETFWLKIHFQREFPGRCLESFSQSQRFIKLSEDCKRDLSFMFSAAVVYHKGDPEQLKKAIDVAWGLVSDDISGQIYVATFALRFAADHSKMNFCIKRMKGQTELKCPIPAVFFPEVEPEFAAAQVSKSRFILTTGNEVSDFHVCWRSSQGVMCLCRKKHRHLRYILDRGKSAFTLKFTLSGIPPLYTEIAKNIKELKTTIKESELLLRRNSTDSSCIASDIEAASMPSLSKISSTEVPSLDVLLKKV